MIEGDAAAAGCLTETEQKAVVTAGYHAVVYEGFGVWETSGNSETIELYAAVTKAIGDMYDEASRAHAAGTAFGGTQVRTIHVPVKEVDRKVSCTLPCTLRLIRQLAICAKRRPERARAGLPLARAR